MTTSPARHAVDGAPAFFAGGGEMGALMRAHDWASHPLGPPERWPSLLKSTLRLLLTSNHPMFIWWGEDLYQFYNDAYRQTLGPERHPSALGQPGRECWKEVWHIIGPEIDHVKAGQGATWHENALIPLTRHGRQEDVYWTYGYSPIEDETGVQGVFVVCNDVTEEHRLKERMKESYHTVIESMDEGLSVVEAILDESGNPVDYRFLEANPAFEHQTGLVNAIGKTAKELVPDLEDRWVQTYGKVALTGEPIRFIEHSAPMNRWFDVYATRIGAAEDLKVAILFRDVTERALTEHALKEADRRKDEFLAMLAHELRNPLAPIAAAAELLQLGTLTPDRISQASAIITRQVGHITGLIDDLLDVSRVTRGMIPLNKTKIDAKRVVADAVEQVRPLIESRGHKLTVHTPPATAFVMGDQKRLVQVMTNLLNNAAKYTPEGGEIVLDMVVSGAFVQLDVIDNGIGMTPEMTERAFELFAQAEREADRSQGGLGIGLALVKSLTELHGGQVHAYSAGPGQGSRFTVRLPHVNEQDADPAPDQHAAPRGAPSRPLKVMVVDDNVDAARMLAMLVESMGHQVAVEHSSRRALERAARFAPDVCLLDLGLPDIDGYELAALLHAMPEAAGAVLVAVTGYGQEQARSSAADAGFAHHFVKPVDARSLVALLDEIGKAMGPGRTLS